MDANPTYSWECSAIEDQVVHPPNQLLGIICQTHDTFWVESMMIYNALIKWIADKYNTLEASKTLFEFV